MAPFESALARHHAATQTVIQSDLRASIRLGEQEEGGKLYDVSFSDSPNDSTSKSKRWSRSQAVNYPAVRGQ